MVVITPSDRLQGGCHEGLLFPMAPGVAPSATWRIHCELPCGLSAGAPGVVSKFLPPRSQPPWALPRSPQRSLCREPVRRSRTA